MASLLRIELLGGFLLIYDDMPVISFDMPRLQSLLAYLLLHRDAPSARSQLAYLLWPDSTDAQAHTNLRNALYKVRQALPNADAFLHSDRQALSWLPQAPWTFDVLEFERALAQAAQADTVMAQQQALTAAIEIYHGDLFPSCYDDWILPERDRLRRLFFQALEQLIMLLEQEHDYSAAIETAQRLLRHDPLHEETYRHLMRLYAESGERAAALHTYHLCATVLQRELGIEPSRATREFYERLVQTREPTGPLNAVRPPLLATAQLVGRKSEWSQLHGEWQSTLTGHPHMVILSGEAGIGKTRLAEEFLAWVGRQGIFTAFAHCYAAESSLAYAPIAVWLRADALRQTFPILAQVWRTEIARLVPELLTQQPDLPRPGPLTENWQRQQLFEALARATMIDRYPLLLVLDDLQWCDRETMEWLHYLLRWKPHARLLLLATMRPEETTPEHPVQVLLATLRHNGQVREIPLGPLDADCTASLAEQVLGRPLGSTVVEHLYRETEGNPLFVVEMLRADVVAHEREATDSLNESNESHPSQLLLSPTVQAVIAARLAQLSPQAREVVSLAAVIGRAFTFALLAQASGGDEDALVNGLDELWQRRIIREQREDAYDFSHDKLREVVYLSLSTVRRRLLHRKVAEALVVLHADNIDAVSGQIATHYAQAHRLQRAITYYQRAGEAAYRVYAHAEALTAFRRAKTLLDALPVGNRQIQWQQEVSTALYERMGDIFALTGQHDEARDAYQQTLTYVPVEQQIARARLHRKIAKTWAAQRLYETAQAAYTRAEDALGQPPPEPAGKWWQEWIRIQDGRLTIHYWRAQLDQMTAIIENMWIHVEEHGTEAQRAAFYLSLASNNLMRDRYKVSEDCLRYVRIALAAYSREGNPVQISWAHGNLGFYYLWHNDLAEAETELQKALSMAERTGDVTGQSHSLTYLSLVMRKRGRLEAIQQIIPQSLARATEAQMPEHIGTARANLAWVAWREKRYSEAQAHGRAALEQWQQISQVFPFHWTALWPLLGVALEQDQLADAVDYARQLLVPAQQRLPDELTALLEAAIRAWEATRYEVAETYLLEATTMAQETGYL